MSYRWPAWAAVSLGALLMVLALWVFLGMPDDPMARIAILPGMLAGGAILLGFGLHALQASNDAWCDDCWDGCDCAHCAECEEGACCGRCACATGDPPNGHGH